MPHEGSEQPDAATAVRRRLRRITHGTNAQAAVPRRQERRRRRRLRRQEGGGPLSLDGGSELGRGQGVGRRGKRDDVRVSRFARHARGLPPADREAIQLSARQRAGLRGAALVLLAQHRPAETSGRVHEGNIERIGTRRTGSRSADRISTRSTSASSRPGNSCPTPSSG
jgi:hypothetical protein